MAGRFPDAKSHEKLWELIEKGLDVHRVVPADRFSMEMRNSSTSRAINTSHTPYRRRCKIQIPGHLDPRFFGKGFPRNPAELNANMEYHNIPFGRHDKLHRVYINNFSVAGGNTSLLLEDAPEPPAMVDPSKLFGPPSTEVETTYMHAGILHAVRMVHRHVLATAQNFIPPSTPLAFDLA